MNGNNSTTAWFQRLFGDEESAFPNNNPPPPPSREDLTTANPYATLPAGWSTAVHPVDGRVYYWETETGRTSWTHPHAPSSAGQEIPPPPPPPPQQPVPRTGSTNSPNNPLLPSSPYGDGHHPGGENPYHATRRPDSNECHSFVALCCCPLIGAMSVYHSCLVNRRWNQGRYGDAVHHARQAPQYATFAIVVGILFWIYWFFFREEGNNRFRWPDGWDFRWGD